MKKICAAMVCLAASLVLAQAGNTNLRGTVSKVSGMSFTLTTASGESVEVKEQQGFRLYDIVAADLSSVKNTSYIGATTVKQADGKEHAIEIRIFPEELRGSGEGSYIMSPAKDTAPRGLMTNGTVSLNRMTNGAVVKTGGGMLQVKYAGGVTDVMVPSNVKVTEIKAISHPVAAGDAIAVTGRKTSNGSIEADRATLVHP
jgi:hypothetical protein